MLGPIAAAVLMASSCAVSAVDADASGSPRTTTSADAATERAASGRGPDFGAAAHTEADLLALEAAINAEVDIVSTFVDFTDPFPATWADIAAARDSALLISWEPWDWDRDGVRQPDYQLADLIAGRHDAYIRSWARAAAAHDGPLMVRLAPEMNGDWRPWSPHRNGNGGGRQYRRAWRHVVQVARAAGATNVRWVFNPIASYAGPYPDGSYPLADLYPGDAWVDAVALDGYNWGDLMPWGWTDVARTFDLGLAELEQVAPGLPVLLAEVGCVPGPGRAAWVADLLAMARQRGIESVIWFEHDKETDWRIAADPGAAAAVQTALA